MTEEQIEAAAKAAFGFHERTFRWESIGHHSQEYWRNTAHAALTAAEAKGWQANPTDKGDAYDKTVDLPASLPRGPISAWPDFGDWEDEDDAWIVGIARNGLGGPAYRIRSGDKCPSCWTEIASVKQGAAMARLLADLLDKHPRGKQGFPPAPPEAG